MKAALITPVGLLERYALKTTYHLVLAHLMDNDDYVEFYRQRKIDGDFVILDNSVIELGEPVDAAWLDIAVKRFEPSELVLPDFPCDPTKTFKAAVEFGPRFKDKWPDMKLMVVPQWSNPGMIEQWMDSFQELAKLDFIDTIGIPKFLMQSRPQVCAMLDGHFVDKEFHLLGTWGNPLEIVELSKYNWIRGVDSKIPVRLGQLGITLHPYRGMLGELRYNLPPLEFTYSDDPMPIITNHNCNVVINWAMGMLVSGGQQIRGEVLPFERT